LIYGVSVTLQAYIDIKATASIDCDWTEFKWLGSATANKRGIDIATSTGSFNMQYCSIHDNRVASSVGLLYSATIGNGFTFSNNVVWNVARTPIGWVAATSATWTVDGNIFMKTIDSSIGIDLIDCGGTFSNNTIISVNGASLQLSESLGNGSITGLTIHSSGIVGFVISSQVLVSLMTFSNFKIWRCGAAGIQLNTGGGFVLNTATIFGNGTNNIQVLNPFGPVEINNATIAGDSSFSTTNGIMFSAFLGTYGPFKFNTVTFGVVSGIFTAHTSDFNSTNTTSYLAIFLNNCILASTTEISNIATTFLGYLGFISSQKHDQTSGLHKCWKKFGTICIETTTVHTGSQSMKLTPNNATYKLESSGPFGGFKVAVANGQTVTPTVYVYEDGSYNGTRARLIVKRNDALGISADTVLDTATAASDAAWEALTGTTAAVTDDGVLEFVIDCDGTAGNLFVDSFSVV
jgi:hypothetical protein